MPGSRIQLPSLLAAIQGDRCRAKKEHLKRFYDIQPEKWLKPGPESGLDCLICAMLRPLNLFNIEPQTPSSQPLRNGDARDSRGLVRHLSRIKSPFSGPASVLALAGIRQIMVHIKATKKDDLLPLRNGDARDS